MLCISHVEENDISSYELEYSVGQLENPFGIFNFVKSLKDEGNIFYKHNQLGSAIAKYSLALKLLSFASVSSEEDKLLFSGTAVSLNLNLGACFIKVKDYDRVGQLCSAVLCFDTTNVKAYYRRAIVALGLNKPTLAFMDLAQALKIDPDNSESQQKLKEVISLLDGHVRRRTGVKDDTKMEKDVCGYSLDLEGHFKNKKPKSDRVKFRFLSRKRNDSYLRLTPTMYGVISKGRTVQYLCSRQKNFITIRVANPLKKMDNGESQEVSPPMEFSHPPVEGHDRCESTPDLMQEDPSIGMAGLESSCEAASILQPVSPVSSPLQTPVHPRTSSSELLLGFVSSSRSRFRRKYVTLQSRSSMFY
uniref:Uncharacterized protein n=1 Tax=Chenopodium quinoa TaxID=63459 RepID=A0A803LGH9_CHEQI